MASTEHAEWWATQRKEFLDKIPPEQYFSHRELADLCGMSIARTHRFLEELVTRGELKQRTFENKGYFLRYIYMKPLTKLPE